MSGVIKCINVQDEEIVFDCKICICKTCTFAETCPFLYISPIYRKHFANTFMQNQIMQIMLTLFGINFNNSLKTTTTGKRGGAIRKKVSPQTAVPSNWKDFLRSSKNKITLFD